MQKDRSIRKSRWLIDTSKACCFCGLRSTNLLSQRPTEVNRSEKVSVRLGRSNLSTLIDMNERRLNQRGDSKKSSSQHQSITAECNRCRQQRQAMRQVDRMLDCAVVRYILPDETLQQKHDTDQSIEVKNVRSSKEIVSQDVCCKH